MRNPLVLGEHWGKWNTYVVMRNRTLANQESCSLKTKQARAALKSCLSSRDFEFLKSRLRLTGVDSYPVVTPSGVLGRSRAGSSEILMASFMVAIRPWPPSPLKAGPKHSGRLIRSFTTTLAFSSTLSPWTQTREEQQELVLMITERTGQRQLKGRKFGSRMWFTPAHNSL